MGGPGLGGTDPERPARGLRGRGPVGPFLQPRSHSVGRRRHRNLPPPRERPPPPDSGEGRRGKETPLPPPGTQLGRHSPHPEKPCRPVPTSSCGTGSGLGGRGSGQKERLGCNTNLAVEDFHSLHVVRAEAPNPAAEDATATALRGESETQAAAQLREGALAGERAAATPGQARKGKSWRARAPLGAARRGHGR